jgi:N-methylhydantoinase B/oxoprolinase/acetone carboxylase alpha subunit
MTAATTSNWQIYVGTAASPQVLTAIEEVFSISGLGQTNSLIDVTNFDSAAGTMEYIAGLADGSEFTVEANYVPGATQQLAVVAAVVAQDTRLCRVDYTGSSPNKSWSFSAVCLGEEIAPSVDDRNTLTFS